MGILIGAVMAEGPEVVLERGSKYRGPDPAPEVPRTDDAPTSCEIELAAIEEQILALQETIAEAGLSPTAGGQREYSQPVYSQSGKLLYRASESPTVNFDPPPRRLSLPNFELVSHRILDQRDGVMVLGVIQNRTSTNTRRLVGISLVSLSGRDVVATTHLDLQLAPGPNEFRCKFHRQHGGVYRVEAIFEPI